MNYYGSSFIKKIIMKFHIPKTSKYSHETVPKKTRNISQRKEQFYFCPEKQREDVVLTACIFKNLKKIHCRDYLTYLP